MVNVDITKKNRANAFSEQENNIGSIKCQMQGGIKFLIIRVSLVAVRNYPRICRALTPEYRGRHRTRRYDIILKSL